MAGRPTKLTQEKIDLAYEYLSNHSDVVPSVTGLCIAIGICRKTAYLWAEDNEDFSDVLERVLMKQEVMLVNGGLSNQYNANITKLLLSKHGYSEKTETDITTKGQSLNTWVVNPVTTKKDA